MDINLDNIAVELYGKLQTRFTEVKIGEGTGEVLSKKEDIPKSRFFEFPYKEQGKVLGTITITLDEDDGVVVQIGGDLVDSDVPGVFKFVRSMGRFANSRLLNFKIVNLEKSNLDKRDYEFQAKRKEPQPMMPPVTPVMESKFYGTSKISYQDLGEARIVIKHNSPVNTELAAGRTMHIESIYVENAQGERFKYPFKHLNGARALAEHLKHGGNPYDGIGKYITGLSEEMASLRKFKGYVGRNEALAEAMGDITGKVFERIEQVKKEVNSLQRKSYYEQFAESFTESEAQDIPETTMEDWVDRLTIRTFNEDLKAAFPYIFKLVSEGDIPVRELTPADMLGEAPGDTELFAQVDALLQSNPQFAAEVKAKNLALVRGMGPDSQRRNAEVMQQLKMLVQKYSGQRESVVAELSTDTMKSYIGKAKKEKDYNQAVYKLRSPIVAPDKIHSEFDPDRKAKINKRTAGIGQAHSKIIDKNNAALMAREEFEFESFINSLVEDGTMQDGVDTLFSPNKEVQQTAIDKLNKLLASDLKSGGNAVNAKLSLKGIIDDPEFIQSLSQVDPDLDIRVLLQQYVQQHAPEVAMQLNFGDEQTGGEEPIAPPEPAPAPPPAPAPAPEAGAIPPGPEAGAIPPAPGAVPPEQLPPAAPIAENTSKLRAKFIKAKECGANLNTKMDFGHRAMTLQDAIKESGLTPMECGFAEEDEVDLGGESGVDQILKMIAGFWNREEHNFTIGGTRAKQKVVSAFKDGEFPNATEEDVKLVLQKIEQMDPSSTEHDNIVKLAGVAQPELSTPSRQDHQDNGINTVIKQLRVKHHPDTQASAVQLDPMDVMKNIIHKINFGK